jgi:hypothetical protein
MVMITADGADGDAAVRSPQSLGGGVSVIIGSLLGDVDAVWERALTAGAERVSPLADHACANPLGNSGCSASRIEDLSREAIERGAASLLGSAD